MNEIHFKAAYRFSKQMSVQQINNARQLKRSKFSLKLRRFENNLNTVQQMSVSLNYKKQTTS